MKHTRVAVLRGGPSNEYDVSMNTGANVIKALSELGYPVRDVVITRKGEWLENGLTRLPEKILLSTDVVFLALHGAYGEDGGVQKLLQAHKIPFTGSNAFTSALAFNKVLTKDTLKPHGILSPQHYKITRRDITRLTTIVEDLIDTFGHDFFVKPITSGSSLGAVHVPAKDYLQGTIEELLRDFEELMVEEYIRGKEATVAVLENFRNESHYALPAVEIVPPADDPVFSYENKYNGRTDEICPGRFSYHEKAKLEEAARLVHQALNCNQYSRSDFIVRDGEIYFLEVNTLPGLTSESLLPKAAEAVGLSYNDLIEHLVSTAKF